MMQVFIAGLLMGSLGSVHCIGMCGPIALSLPMVNDQPSSRFIGTLLYNGGRIFTYAALGALFGLVGLSFSLFGMQQWLSILLGVLILAFLVIPAKAINRRNPATNLLVQLRQKLAHYFTQRNYQSLFFIGLLNGLLPCGMVYLAMAGAVATATVEKSSLFMAAFGLGTLPVMWSLAFFGTAINLSVRQRIKKLYPYVMFVMASWLIIRGLGLEIPYLSPGNGGLNIGNAQNALNCH
ncbi:MAG: sulfite exporter TauE/SafE family protein [Bacteroidota bacterium]